MSAAVLSITDANFAAEVTNRPGLVMVDFWAAWCGPCRAVAPVVEKLAEKFAGQIKIAKLDVDANPTTVAELGIRSMPTFIFFQNGQPTFAISGAMNERDFTKLVERVISFNGDRARIEQAYQADRDTGALGAA